MPADNSGCWVPCSRARGHAFVDHGLDQSKSQRHGHDYVTMAFNVNASVFGRGAGGVFEWFFGRFLERGGDGGRG